MHKYVDEQHTLIREDTQRTKYRELGSDGTLTVGDYCLVKKAPVAGISTRLQVPTFDQVFQVVETHGIGIDAKAYTLSNLSGSRENLGFTQPVALDRLIPIELLPLAQTDVDQATRILVHQGSNDRRATIKGQTMDGKVYIQYDDMDVEQCVDLSNLKYQWLG